MFTCDDTTKAYLEEWAETENRTVSNLVETLIQDAIATRQQNDEPPASDTAGSKGRGKK
jgi:hypothetical protein